MHTDSAKPPYFSGSLTQIEEVHGGSGDGNNLVPVKQPENLLVPPSPHPNFLFFFLKKTSIYTLLRLGKGGKKGVHLEPVRLAAAEQFPPPLSFLIPSRSSTRLPRQTVAECNGAREPVLTVCVFACMHGKRERKREKERRRA